MKIEKQKGPLNPSMKTMKTITPEERSQESYEQRKLKYSGQTFDKVHSPKTGKK